MSKQFPVGNPCCGLVGPFSHASDIALRRVRKCRVRFPRPGDGLQPLYLVAVAPPLKKLRGELDQLAHAVLCHLGHIGVGQLAGFFPAADGGQGACIDFLDTSAINSCPRYGTRFWFIWQRDWFYARFAERQAHAMGHGRYFPPPKVLRAEITAAGEVVMVMGFADGFLPHQGHYLLKPSQRGRRSQGSITPG